MTAASRAGRPEPLLIGGHPGLDFLNSVAVLEGERVDWLADGAGLVAWLAATPLAPGAPLQHLRRDTPARALDAVAGEARALREWWRGEVGRLAGAGPGPLPPVALRPLNRLLAEGTLRLQLGPREAGLGWEYLRPWERVEELLQPLAWAIGEALRALDFRYVRQCEGRGCTLWFVDTSRGHQRRWCSMALCGNRSKAAGFRARAR